LSKWLINFFCFRKLRYQLWNSFYASKIWPLKSAGHQEIEVGDQLTTCKKVILRSGLPTPFIFSMLEQTQFFFALLFKSYSHILSFCLMTEWTEWQTRENQYGYMPLIFDFRHKNARLTLSGWQTYLQVKKCYSRAQNCELFTCICDLISDFASEIQTWLPF
jgi:hypothetical protein